METTLTIIGLAVAAVIALGAAGIAIYKWVYNTKADLSPREEKNS